MINILAIESSCDETAAAVVQDGRKVLSSEIASQVELHALYGGVVPEVAARSHIEAIVPLVKRAVANAAVTIDAIAVTCAPGLIGALLVGVNFAKSYALASGLPLIPVHHIRGHIAAAYLEYPELEPPFLALVVSGGHTLLVHVKDYTDFAVIGSTMDDAAGEAFDKIARVLGLGYPGGSALSRLASEGDETRYKLPSPLGTPSSAIFNSLDFSFSGLKTAAVNLIHNAEQKGDAIDKPSLAACFEKAVCDALVSRAARGSAVCGCKRVVLCGGVAANGRLRKQMISTFGDNIHIPNVYLCGDNAAMIGAQAYYELQAGHTANTDLNGYANLEVDCNWKMLCKP